MNALRFKDLFTAKGVKRISALDSYAFDLRTLKGEYAAHTLDTVYENDLMLYDASYISLAILEEAQMYTADRRFIDKLHEPYRKFVKDLLLDAQI